MSQDDTISHYRFAALRVSTSLRLRPSYCMRAPALLRYAGITPENKLTPKLLNVIPSLKAKAFPHASVAQPGRARDL